jgi:phosphatidylglycerophosphatase A
VAPGRRLLYLLATGFGSGFSPFAPGTAGTLAAIPVYIALAWLLPTLGFVAFSLAFIPLAIVAAGVGGRMLAAKDPGPVVVDEWAGYYITLAGHALSWQGVVAGFFIFRVLDVLKPFPARRLEHLPGGTGIVMHDVMVGVYGNLLLWLLHLAQAHL